MKVLVTGGAGFIASHVVNGYLDLGHDVVVVDNLSTGQKENLNPAAAFYHMDVADDELDRVFAEERPDVVNHHAAQVNVRKSLQAPLHDAKINILGSLNVLDDRDVYPTDGARNARASPFSVGSPPRPRTRISAASPPGRISVSP